MWPTYSIRPLTEELQKIAIEQLNEVPERIPKDLEALRTWLEQQPHLKARTDDQLLLAFLRGCKFSLEKAKNKIDRFYTLRTKFPEYFRVDDVDSTLEILRLGALCYLPKPLNDNGPSICLMRIGAYSADKYTFIDVMRMSQLFMERIIRDNDNANINGIVVILDFANVTMNHALQITPTITKKVTVWTEEVIPLRLQANHFLNVPKSFETLLNMVKSMFSKKQQERIFFHSNLDSFCKHFPKKYLPTEYGGENGSLKDILEHWEKLSIRDRDYFEDEHNYGTDEKLRPGKPINFDNVFGVEGSFRAIEVD